MSAEGEPCNIAIGNIETNTADYYTVRDRGDSDGVGGLDLDSRHHHAVRDGSWYGEDHKIRCINWNAVDGHSHTYYCEANICRGDRGYNQNCDHSSQCHSNNCYYGKCMAACASGVYSADAFTNDDRANQCAQDGEICSGDNNECGGNDGDSTCYIQAALGAAAGVCRPPGTRCDWCEDAEDCDRNNVRLKGSYECNQWNECMLDGSSTPDVDQKLPGGAECRDDDDCRSNCCAGSGSSCGKNWAGDSDGTGNIMRRYCRSEQYEPCNRVPTNRNGHPTLAAGYDVDANTGEHCWGNVGDFTLSCVGWEEFGQVGVGNTDKMSRTHMCDTVPFQSEIDAAALEGITLDNTPRCYKKRPHTATCRWDGQCASDNGCERDSSQCLADDGQAGDGTICTSNAQCGDHGGKSICYFASFLSAVAGVNTKICRPPGTECDWCLVDADCDVDGWRGFGVFRCSQWNECMHYNDGLAADGAACRNHADCASNECADWAGDSDGTGNINRRNCRSVEGGPCNRRPTNKDGHPTLPVNYVPSSIVVPSVQQPGEHCFGDANDFTLTCKGYQFHGGFNYHGSGEQSPEYACVNNICTSEVARDQPCYWNTQCLSNVCDEGNDGYKLCMARPGEAADGEICNADDQCGGSGGLSYCLPNSAASGRASGRCQAPQPECGRCLSQGHGLGTASHCQAGMQCRFEKCNYITGAPGGHQCMYGSECQSGHCVDFSFDIDEIADPDINRRYCSSITGQSCGQQTINAGHCTGSFSDRTTYCHDSSTNYCDNNICSTSRAYGQACDAGGQCASGQCGHGICLHARNSYVGYSDHSSGHYCVYDDQCSSARCAQGRCKPKLGHCEHGCNPGFSDCLDGYFCNLEGGWPNMCLKSASAENGWACRTDGACASGTCANWAGAAQRRYCSATAGQLAGGREHCYSYTGREGNACTPAQLTVGDTGVCEYGAHCEACTHAGAGDSQGGCSSGTYCSFQSGMSNRCLKTNARGGEQCFSSSHCVSGSCNTWGGDGQRRYCHPLNGEKCEVWTDQVHNYPSVIDGHVSCHCSAGNGCSPKYGSNNQAYMTGHCAGGNSCSNGYCSGGVSPLQMAYYREHAPLLYAHLAANITATQFTLEMQNAPAIPASFSLTGASLSSSTSHVGSVMNDGTPKAPPSPPWQPNNAGGVEAGGYDTDNGAPPNAPQVHPMAPPPHPDPPPPQPRQPSPPLLPPHDYSPTPPPPPDVPPPPVSPSPSPPPSFPNGPPPLPAQPLADRPPPPYPPHPPSPSPPPPNPPPPPPEPSPSPLPPGSPKPSPPPPSDPPPPPAPNPPPWPTAPPRTPPPPPPPPHPITATPPPPPPSSPPPTPPPPLPSNVVEGPLSGHCTDNGGSYIMNVAICAQVAAGSGHHQVLVPENTTLHPSGCYRYMAPALTQSSTMHQQFGAGQFMFNQMPVGHGAECSNTFRCICEAV